MRAALVSVFGQCSHISRLMGTHSYVLLVLSNEAGCAAFHNPSASISASYLSLCLSATSTASPSRAQGLGGTAG